MVVETCPDSFYNIDPAQADNDALWRLVSRTIYKREIITWNFDTIMVQVLTLSYQNLELTYFMVWKVSAFWHCSNFGNFWQFFLIITFDWIINFKVWWFHWKKLVQIYQNQPYFNLKTYSFIHLIKFLGEIIHFFL